MTTATNHRKTDQGHAAHTQAADRQQGLDGHVQRPIKVTMIGAGSHFTHKLMNDILLIPGAERGEIALVDTDERRLKPMVEIVQRLIDACGRDHWSVTATTDRREVLPGTDYLINSIDVGGVENVRADNDIPLEYGIDQCIGDTIGPGGLFKALRTVPVWLDILRDAERYCPDALVLNYTNPMNIMMLSAGRAVPSMQAVGLCHSVQGTSHLLARYAEVPYEQMRWQCAGINHLAWFTTLEHEGEDLYEKVLYEKFRREVEAGLREADEGKARHDGADIPHGLDHDGVEYEGQDLVRKDMCLNFGAFITESSGHLSEYLPFYRKSERGRKLLRLGYHGGSSFYANNWPNWRKKWDADRDAVMRGDAELAKSRSWEYASWIIEAREKDTPWRIHGNVMNSTKDGTGQLITNLPADGCVEVACLIDRAGLHPTRYGKLPAQMAGVCDWNMRMFDLAATACIEQSKEAAAHALMLDPLSAAVCTPGEIREMTMKMFDAEQDFLQGYK